MDTQKQQVADSLKQATNILVTVSANPTVDQLAACIGLTLALNKMGKHATAVFSGAIPNTIEFLQPEKTIEKDTNSLRDFIIALDKSKADKLRYKVEDKVVKIFITPYKTSLSEKDLQFSQGDFNVDVIVALGVHKQADLDQAITAHGRILHDAVVTTINVKPGGELGALNWLNPQASSLSELVTQLIAAIDKTMIDEQMATALLTGIVAETERFSNARTTPQTMSTSAELMAAGANQQLVATKLEEGKPKPVELPTPAAGPKTEQQASQPAGLMAAAAVPAKKDEGTLEIDHPVAKLDLSSLQSGPEETEKPAEKEEITPQIDIDREGTLRRLEEIKAAEKKAEEDSSVDSGSHLGGQRMILQPPTMGGQLTANAEPQNDSLARNPLSLPSPDGDSGLTQERPSGAPPIRPSDNLPPLGGTGHTVPVPPAPAPLPVLNDIPGPAPAPTSPLPAVTPVPPQMTAVDNTTAAPAPVPTNDDHLASARDAVHQAINSQPVNGPLPPIAALNAQPIDLNTPTMNPAPGGDPAPGVVAPPPMTPLPPPGDTPSFDPNAPPPVPPPMMPMPPQPPA